MTAKADGGKGAEDVCENGEMVRGEASLAAGKPQAARSVCQASGMAAGKGEDRPWASALPPARPEGRRPDVCRTTLRTVALSQTMGVGQTPLRNTQAGERSSNSAPRTVSLQIRKTSAQGIFWVKSCIDPEGQAAVLCTRSIAETGTRLGAAFDRMIAAKSRTLGMPRSCKSTPRAIRQGAFFCARPVTHRRLITRIS